MQTQGCKNQETNTRLSTLMFHPFARRPSSFARWTSSERKQRSSARVANLQTFLPQCDNEPLEQKVKRQRPDSQQTPQRYYGVPPRLQPPVSPLGWEIFSISRLGAPGWLPCPPPGSGHLWQACQDTKVHQSWIRVPVCREHFCAAALTSTGYIEWNVWTLLQEARAS